MAMVRRAAADGCAVHAPSLDLPDALRGIKLSLGVSGNLEGWDFGL